MYTARIEHAPDGIVVDLHGLRWDDGEFMLIVKDHKSIVRYRNLVGDSPCQAPHTPSARGYLFPLARGDQEYEVHQALEAMLGGVWWHATFITDHRKKIDTHLSTLSVPMKLDHERLVYGGESWLHVIASLPCSVSALGRVEHPSVLTWRRPSLVV